MKKTKKAAKRKPRTKAKKIAKKAKRKLRAPCKSVGNPGGSGGAWGKSS